MHIEDYEIRDPQVNELLYVQYEQKGVWYDFTVPFDVVKAFIESFENKLYVECIEPDSFQAGNEYYIEQTFNYQTFEAHIDNEQIRRIVKYSIKNNSSEVTINKLD